MIQTLRKIYRFAKHQQVIVNNIFNATPIAKYTSPDDTQIKQFLAEGQTQKQIWRKRSREEKQTQIIKFIDKFNQPEVINQLINTLSASTGKQTVQCQAQIKIALKIFNFQLGHIYSKQKKIDKNYYTFEPFDFVTSIFDHRHPILSAFAYLGLSLRSNNSLILRPSPLALPPVKMIEKLWEQCSQVKMVRCLVDPFIDPKNKDSPILNILNSTDGFINFSGRMKDGLDFHYYMSKVNEVFRQTQFLLTSSDSAYVLKDLSNQQLHKAAQIIARACFSNCGHNFNSIKRVFVDRQIAETFQTLLIQQSEQYVIDPKLNQNFENQSVNKGLLAPFLIKSQFQECKKKLQQLTQKYKQQIVLLKGGQLITLKGKKPEAVLNFVTPTIFKVTSDFPNFNYQNVTYMMPICFISIVDSPESCVQKINSSIYGISSSLFTNNTDLKTIEPIASKLDVGTVNVNTWEVTDGITYSGRKRSGKGFSFSPLSFNNIVRTKSVSNI